MEFDRRTLLGGALAAGTAAIAAPAAAPTSLDAIARRRGLRFGTAVSADHLGQQGLARLIASECSVLTPENELKWKHLEPRPAQYRTDGADRIAGFAKQNKLELRGHTFMWNQDNRICDWMLADEAALKANGGKKLVELMQQHSDFITTRFPEVTSWDAVNEVIQVQDGQFRDSLYTRILGDRFIDLAYEMMRTKAPHAQMVYNDYMSWDAKPEHRNGVLKLLEDCLKRGVKIDALGIQSHIGGSLGRKIDEAAWRRFLERVEAMGLDILITELDCSDRNVATQDVAKRDADTAAYTKGYLDVTLSFRRVKQVVTWSLSDYDSYLNRSGYPNERRRPDGLPMRGHLYDAAFKPKPLRAAIAAALAAAPMR